jgi:hypothetical protein
MARTSPTLKGTTLTRAEINRKTTSDRSYRRAADRRECLEQGRPAAEEHRGTLIGNLVKTGAISEEAFPLANVPCSVQVCGTTARSALTKLIPGDARRSSPLPVSRTRRLVVAMANP